MPVPSAHGARYGTVAAALRIAPQLRLVVIRSVALLGVLILGQVSVAGNLERVEGRPPDNSVQAASTGRVQSGFPIRVARLGSGSTLLPLKRFHAFPKIARSGDPNDDAMSDDPNDDDDSWDDLNGDDDTSVPIIAWFQEMVPYLSAPECAPVTWTAHLPSPFLTLQRLRC